MLLPWHVQLHAADLPGLFMVQPVPQLYRTIALASAEVTREREAWQVAEPRFEWARGVQPPLSGGGGV